jgi:NADPH2:quinone reductase
MKAIYLVKTGSSQQAFEFRNVDIPEPQEGHVLIKVHYSGLNFADVLARRGLYPDAPKLPCVVGYDVSGEIEAVGPGVIDFKKGDRVTAMSRFGGYAEYVATDVRATIKLPDNLDSNIAPALMTQGCTAYYCAEEMVNIFKGDHVLVHSAAGGVGTILCEIAKHKGAVIYGTVGSDKKMEYLKKLGVDYPINYKKTDFSEVISGLRGKPGIDIIFDAVGGTNAKKGFKLLGSGGRLVLYGAAQMTEAKNAFQKIKKALDFGIYHPLTFVTKSKSFIGVNLLRIADNKPETLKRVGNSVIRLVKDGVIKPNLGAEFSYKDVAKAHEFLESGKSTGKIVLQW